MDVTSQIISLIEKCNEWLKTSTFTSFGVTVSLFDVLIGGIILFLVLYFIFRIGE
jgi:hypothetical protein